MDRESRDDELRSLLAEGDPAAIDLLWQGYANRLFGFLMAMLRSRHDAEDVLQDVFVRIARNRSKVARARNLKAYLFRMARNVAVSLIRRRAKGVAVARQSEAWLLSEEDPSDGSGAAEELTEALGRLPDKQRVVIVLKVYEEMTFAEIGEALGVSLNTAASRYRYGLEKLREWMGRDAT